MSKHTIRIDSDTHQRLRDLAASEGEPMARIVAKAVAHFENEIFLDKADAAYEALRADPVLWQRELEERAVWDVTLLDGLEEEVWFEDSDGVDDGDVEEL